MKIDYQGSVYEFDPAALTVAECEEIEKFCSVRGMGEWGNQLTVANTKALQALWWAVRRQSGEDPGPVARRDPGFRPLAFSLAYSAAERAEAEAEAAAAKAAAEAAAEAEPDPTAPAGSSPAPSAVTPTTPGSVPAAPSPPG